MQLLIILLKKNIITCHQLFECTFEDKKLIDRQIQYCFAILSKTDLNNNQRIAYLKTLENKPDAKLAPTRARRKDCQELLAKLKQTYANLVDQFLSDNDLKLDPSEIDQHNDNNASAINSLSTTDNLAIATQPPRGANRCSEPTNLFIDSPHHCEIITHEIIASGCVNSFTSNEMHAPPTLTSEDSKASSQIIENTFAIDENNELYAILENISSLDDLMTYADSLIQNDDSDPTIYQHTEQPKTYLNIYSFFNNNTGLQLLPKSSETNSENVKKRKSFS